MLTENEKRWFEQWRRDCSSCPKHANTVPYIDGLIERLGYSIESKKWYPEFISNEPIMQCSKEAVAKASMCRAHAIGAGRCPEPAYCSFVNAPCRRITPQDWEKVLNNQDKDKAMKGAVEKKGKRAPAGSCIGAYERFSKRALIRTILCMKDTHYECGAAGGDDDKCPIYGQECHNISPADWWDADILPQHKGKSFQELAMMCMSYQCPVGETENCPLSTDMCANVTVTHWEAIAE